MVLLEGKISKKYSNDKGLFAFLLKIIQQNEKMVAELVCNERL